MQTTVELLTPFRLNLQGVIYERGVETPVDFDTAVALSEDERFRVRGLNSREALDHAAKQTRPSGGELMDAIREAVDSLDEDDANYDRSGKPSVDALSRVLGYPVSVEERDRAMSGSTTGQLDAADSQTKKTGVVIKKATPAAPKTNAPPQAPARTDDEPKVEV